MSYQNSSEIVNSLWDESRLGYLGLACYEKFGAASLGKIQKKFGEKGGGSAWNSSVKEIISVGIAEKAAMDFCSWRDKQNLSEFKTILGLQGIDFVLPWDKIYPAIFREMHNPPAALFWRGAPLDNRIWISVVGTRKMSSYGERAVRHIVKGLVQRGAGIVSGLALGIDGMAHKVALENEGKTIAVLGSGLDDKSIYPVANKNLAEQILLKQGTLISEFPPGTAGLKFNFPLRNRIIAALSKATVVVEADINSGSVLTAKNALESNRDVYVVPGSIFSPGSRGVHALIQNGAAICESAEDILHANHPVTDPAPTITRELTKDERDILDLCRTPIHLDDLSRHLKSPIASITATCLNLELANAITNTGNQTYELTPAGRILLKSQ